MVVVGLLITVKVAASLAKFQLLRTKLFIYMLVEQLLHQALQEDTMGEVQDILVISVVEVLLI
jgi:hypothetical protein